MEHRCYPSPQITQPHSHILTHTYTHANQLKMRLYCLLNALQFKCTWPSRKNNVCYNSTIKCIFRKIILPTLNTSMKSSEYKMCWSIINCVHFVTFYSDWWSRDRMGTRTMGAGISKGLTSVAVATYANSVQTHNPDKPYHMDKPQNHVLYKLTVYFVGNICTPAQ